MDSRPTWDENSGLTGRGGAFPRWPVLHNPQLRHRILRWDQTRVEGHWCSGTRESSEVLAGQSAFLRMQLRGRRSAPKESGVARRGLLAAACPPPLDCGENRRFRARTEPRQSQPRLGLPETPRPHPRASCVARRVLFSGGLSAALGLRRESPLSGAHRTPPNPTPPPPPRDSASPSNAYGVARRGLIAAACPPPLDCGESQRRAGFNPPPWLG